MQKMVIVKTAIGFLGCTRTYTHTHRHTRTHAHIHTLQVAALFLNEDSSNNTCNQWCGKGIVLYTYSRLICIILGETVHLSDKMCLVFSAAFWKVFFAKWRIAQVSNIDPGRYTLRACAGLLLVFAEYDGSQPVSSVVNFIQKMMREHKHSSKYGKS